MSKNKNNNSDILKFLAEAKNLVIEKKVYICPKKKELTVTCVLRIDNSGCKICNDSKMLKFSYR